jgi:integrase
VLHTSTGGKQNPSNLRRSLLTKAVDAANVTLAEAGIALVGHVTFHSFRRTYAPLRCAVGDDVVYTSNQIGHTDARFTLRVYAQAVSRRERMARPQREAFDAAFGVGRMGYARGRSFGTKRH